MKLIKYLFTLFLLLNLIAEKSAFALLVLKGEGEVNFSQVIPKRSEIYTKKCTATVVINDHPNPSNKTHINYRVDCDNEVWTNSNLELKKNNNLIFLIDADGYISGKPDGEYKPNGDFYFSYKTSKNINLKEIENQNCKAVHKEKSFTLNEYTYYQFEKRNEAYLFQKYTTLDELQKEEIINSNCPQIRGIRYIKKGFKKTFIGELFLNNN